MAKKASPSKQLARLRGSLKNLKVRAKQTELIAVEKGAMVATTAIVGYTEQKITPDIAGMPTKLIGAVAAYALAVFTKGHLSRVAEGVGDSLVNIYGYKVAKQLEAGQSQPFVAGSGKYPSIDWTWEG